MNIHEFLKTLKCDMNRKAQPSATLDNSSMNDKIEGYASKWNLTDFSEDDYMHHDEQLDLNHNATLQFEIQDIKNLIPQLPRGKSPGEDQTINEFIINATDEMLHFILLAFNLIIKTGITPEIFHKNLIIPLYKNKNLPFVIMLSHRPIALSSILKKLFEMLTKPLVIPHLHSGFNQYAYKPYCSTSDAVHHYQSIMEQLGKKVRN